MIIGDDEGLRSCGQMLEVFVNQRPRLVCYGYDEGRALMHHG